MKKILLLVALTGWVVAGAVAQTQVRLATEVSFPFSGGLDLGNVTGAWQDGRNAYLGFTPEVILGNQGFGFDSAARFTRNPDDQSWSLDFRGQMFASYHFFGVGGVLDPFVSAGLGSAGGVDLTRGVRFEGGPNLVGLALSLEPSLGFGAAIDLGGLVVGTRILWYPVAWDIPASPIEGYSLSPFQAGVFVAWALGDHR